MQHCTKRGCKTSDSHITWPCNVTLCVQLMVQYIILANRWEHWLLLLRIILCDMKDAARQVQVGLSVAFLLKTVYHCLNLVLWTTASVQPCQINVLDSSHALSDYLTALSCSVVTCFSSFTLMSRVRLSQHLNVCSPHTNLIIKVVQMYFIYLQFTSHRHHQQQQHFL